MIVDVCERILDGLFLILLECGDQLHGIVVDVLDHKDESVIVFVERLGTAEDELDPDELALKVTHHAVVRGGTAGCEILLKILGIRSS